MGLSGRIRGEEEDVVTNRDQVRKLAQLENGLSRTTRKSSPRSTQSAACGALRNFIQAADLITAAPR